MYENPEPIQSHTYSFREVYLDHAAAMPVDPAVLSRLQQLFDFCYANQESAGSLGRQSAKALKEAGDMLKSAVFPAYFNEYSVLWCQSGTEAVNAAVHLIRLYYPDGGDILYSRGEHASIISILRYSLGPQYRALPVALKSDGLLDLDDFEQKAAAGKRIIACIVHFVQSETGVIQDLLQIRHILSKYHPSALFFSDTIQGIGKIAFPGDTAKPDIITLSGQKSGLPAG